MVTQNVIQTGDKTHHHDQSILSSSFRIIKTIVRTLTNPIPPEELVVVVAIFLSYRDVTFPSALAAPTGLRVRTKQAERGLNIPVW